MSYLLALLALAVVAAVAVATGPAATFSKFGEDGWRRVSSRVLVQNMAEEIPERNDDSWKYSGVASVSETDDEDEVEGGWSGPGDDDDDNKGKDDDKDDDDDGSAKQNAEMEGAMCVHRESGHTIERGSVEFNQKLCLLCACQLHGHLYCLETC